MSLTLKQKINSIKYFLTHPEALKMILSFYESGYLHDVGWFRSLEEKKPVDKHGNPLPWFTYSAIEFIQTRLSESLKIFEYGSGNSTIFFSEKVSLVYAAEHDEDWLNELRNYESVKLKLLYANSDTPEHYIKPLINSDFKFDIIIVDGLYRNDCIKNSLEFLTEEGIIILDDSEREEYLDGIEYLLQKKFMKLDFWGIAPIVFHKKCTSIFYKEKNCIRV